MISKLQRWGELANGEIDAGILPIQSYKVPRLDNDPDFPENGRLVLVMRGGLRNSISSVCSVISNSITVTVNQTRK